jgi:hypothetical protein
MTVDDVRSPDNAVPMTDELERVRVISDVGEPVGDAATLGR